MQLSVPEGDGASLRAHLLAVKRATGEVDKRLAEVSTPLPRAVGALWHTFEVLSGTRASDGAITFAEMQAWQRLQGIQLSPWEVETITAMDQAALSASAEARNRRK